MSCVFPPMPFPIISMMSTPPQLFFPQEPAPHPAEGSCPLQSEDLGSGGRVRLHLKSFNIKHTHNVSPSLFIPCRMSMLGPMSHRKWWSRKPHRNLNCKWSTRSPDIHICSSQQCLRGWRVSVLPGKGFLLHCTRRCVLKHLLQMPPLKRHELGSNSNVYTAFLMVQYHLCLPAVAFVTSYALGRHESAAG